MSFFFFSISDNIIYYCFFLFLIQNENLDKNDHIHEELEGSTGDEGDRTGTVQEVECLKRISEQP